MARKTKSTKKAAAAGKLLISGRGGARRALSVATNQRKPAQERIAALSELPLAVSGEEDVISPALRILRDKQEAIETRLGALQAIQAASFSVVAFKSYRSDYIAALREVATDPDPELRQRALGMLAREKDGFAQKKLLEGLRKPEKALVSPEKALQLISYDPHAEAYPVAREIVDKPPNTMAKREALRLLSADPAAAPVFEKILRDKDEEWELRQLSAAALQALEPAKLQTISREILDRSDDERVQAACVTALTHFGEPEAISADKSLLKRVEKMGAKEAGGEAQESARQFLQKYGK